MCVICTWAQGHRNSRTAESRYGEKKKGFCSWTRALPSLPHTLLLPGPGSQQRKLITILRRLLGRAGFWLEQRQVLACEGGCPGSQNGWDVALAFLPTCCVTSREPFFLCCHSRNCNRSWEPLTCCDPEPGGGQGQAGETGRAPFPDALEFCFCPPVTSGLFMGQHHSLTCDLLY